MGVKRSELSKDASDRAAHSHPHDGWVILYNVNPSRCQITAGDLGLRVNWVHGQCSGTLGCLNGIMLPGITQTEKGKVSLIQMTGRWQCDEEVYCASCPFCLESIVLWGQRCARSGEWAHYPPFLQENITFRNNGEWICSQFPLKPVQGLWEIMQMKQACKDVFRFVCYFYDFLSFEMKFNSRSVSFSPTWSDTCII